MITLIEKLYKIFIYLKLILFYLLNYIYNIKIKYINILIKIIYKNF